MNFIKKSLHDKNTLVTALVATLFIIFGYSPSQNGPVTSYDRSFSAIGALGLSLSYRTSHFYLFYMIIIPAVFFACAFTVYGLLYRREGIRSVLYKMSAAFSVLLPVLYLTKYSDYKESIILSPVPKIIVITLFLGAFFACIDKYNHIKTEEIYGLMLVSLALTQAALLISNQTPSLGFIGSHVSVVYLLLYSVFCVFFLLAPQKIRNHGLRCINFMTWIPFVLLAGLEFCYILICRGVTIHSTYKISVIITFVFFVVALIIVFFKKCEIAKIHTCGYIGLLASMVAAITSPAFSSAYTDITPYSLYELGNTTAFYESAAYGGIPGVNYFPAHMLSDVLSDAFYYLFNGDLLGIMVDHYSGFKLFATAIILFLIVREFLEEGPAFLVALVLPYLSIDYFNTINLNFLPVLALFLVIKHSDRLSSYMFYWASLLFGVLYHLDHGLGLGLGCMLALLYLAITGQVTVSHKKNLISLSAVSVSAFLIFIIGCIHERVSVIARLKDFIAATIQSNPQWGMESLGVESTFGYFYVYFLMPLLSIGILISLIIVFKPESIGDRCLHSLCMSLALSVPVMLSRSLVLYVVGNGSLYGRHFGYFHWLIAFYCIYIIRLESAGRTSLFGIFFTIIVSIQLMASGGSTPHAYISPLVQGIAVSEVLNLRYDSDMGKERTVLNSTSQELYDDLDAVFSVLMNEDETFLDFANSTALYAFMQRKNPGYVAQSPALLTTEASQISYIERLEKAGNVKIALLPCEYDQSSNYGNQLMNIRYYRVAEYIYRNFKPLLRVRNFAVWVRNEDYNSARSMLGSIMVHDLESGSMTTVLEIDYHYGNYEPLHTYILGDHPWQWANLDKKAAAGTVLATAVSSDLSNYEYGHYDLATASINKSNGNCLKLTLDCITDSGYAKVKFTDANDSVVCEFNMTLRNGIQNYIIRVSSDMNWYTDEITGLTIESSAELVDLPKVLEGN